MVNPRYRKNPFLEGMFIPVKDRQVKLSPLLGKEDNILINQNTGEVHGTHLITYKQVDSQQFVKLFTENIGLVFDLTSAGIKAFTIVVSNLQKSAISRDKLILDSYVFEEFINENGKNFSYTTFRRGLLELESAQIIARAIRKGEYYINPNFIFNGDRIAFTTLIEKKSTGRSGTIE